jgi:hypothetical protein
MILYVKMYRQMYLLKIETMDILPYKTRFSRDFFRKYFSPELRKTNGNYTKRRNQ